MPNNRSRYPEWFCVQCRSDNFATRKICRFCSAYRPQDYDEGTQERTGPLRVYNNNNNNNYNNNNYNNHNNYNNYNNSNNYNNHDEEYYSDDDYYSEESYEDEFLSLPDDYDVIVAECDEDCENWVNQFPRNSDIILGIDMEWPPDFQPGSNNPPVLLQLADFESCLLVLIDGYLPRPIARFLRRKNVYCYGIGLRNDRKKLPLVTKTQIANWIDLDHVAKECGYQPSRGNLFGKSSLCEEVLGMQFSNRFVQFKANGRLTQEQIDYAALDAWLCLEVASELVM